MSFCQRCGAALPAHGAACAICASRMVAGRASSDVTSDVTSGGLEPNSAAALAYTLGLVTGVLFLVIGPYKNDKYVRFHAFQSIFFNIVGIGIWIVWMVAGLLLDIVTKGLFLINRLPVNLLLILGGFILWILLMYRAYQGRYFLLPFIGTIAANRADT